MKRTKKTEYMAQVFWLPDMNEACFHLLVLYKSSDPSAGS